MRTKKNVLTKAMAAKLKRLIVQPLKGNAEREDDTFFDSRVENFWYIEQDCEATSRRGFVEFKIVGGKGCTVVNATVLERLRQELGGRVVGVAMLEDEEIPNALDVVIYGIDFAELAAKLK